MPHSESAVAVEPGEREFPQKHSEEYSVPKYLKGEHNSAQRSRVMSADAKEPAVRARLAGASV